MGPGRPDVRIEKKKTSGAEKPALNENPSSATAKAEPTAPEQNPTQEAKPKQEAEQKQGPEPKQDPDPAAESLPKREDDSTASNTTAKAGCEREAEPSGQKQIPEQQEAAAIPGPKPKSEEKTEEKFLSPTETPSDPEPSFRKDQLWPTPPERRVSRLRQTDGPILDFSSCLDYDSLLDAVETLAERYPALTVRYLGATILSRAIPVLILGKQDARTDPQRSVLYLGGMGAGDSAAAPVLLRFVNDYFEFLQKGRRLYSVNLPYLFDRRRIYVIPMLNCDGCTIRQKGAGSHLLRERLLSMNTGSADFSQWEANARGVDLRHNFFPGFHRFRASSGVSSGAPSGYVGTSPESEPETASLCGFLRLCGGMELLLRLHHEGNELAYRTGVEGVPRNRTVGRMIARMSGAQIRYLEEASGTVTDWFTEEFRKPAFSLGCLDDSLGPDGYLQTYALLREVLFSLPLLI